MGLFFNTDKKISFPEFEDRVMPKVRSLWLNDRKERFFLLCLELLIFQKEDRYYKDINRKQVDFLISKLKEYEDDLDISYSEIEKVEKILNEELSD